MNSKQICKSNLSIACSIDLKDTSKSNRLKSNLCGRTVYVLLDSGATVSCISKNVYSRCAKSHPMKPSNVKSVLGVGGHLTDVLGCAMLPIKVAGLTMWQEFLVLPGSNKPEVICGKDFLDKQDANWLFRANTVSFHNNTITANLESPEDLSADQVCFIRTISDTVIPAMTETLLPVKVSPRGKTSKSRLSHDQPGIISPTMSIIDKYKVTGPHCAVEPIDSKCCYRLLNPYPTDSLIPRDTVIGTYSHIISDPTLVHIAPMPEALHINTAPREVDTPVQSTLNVSAPEFIPKSHPSVKQHTCSVSAHVDMLFHYTESVKTCTGNVMTTQTDSQTEHTKGDGKPTDEGCVQLDRQYYIDVAKDLNVDVSSDNLTTAQQNDLLELIGRNRDVFAIDTNELGSYEDYQHVIDTGDHAPVKARFYRTSPAQKVEIEKQIEKLLEAGIVERSTSDWLSPVILVRKANLKYRLVVDYRALNRLVKPVYFPLPRQEDVIDALGQAKPTIFSTLDLAQAFLQVKLDPATKHKTGFITHHGVFQFTRTPYGLSNSPASFSLVMSQVLRDFLYVYAIVYADDVLLYSNSFDTHKQHISNVFDKLRMARLRLRPEKCKFGQSSCTYLGHVVSKEGISVNPEKTKAITSFPVPTSQSQLRTFLGLAQYYRRFIRGFSHIASTLTNLLKKDAKFVWDSQCQKAFDTLRTALTSSPILAYPDFDREFTLCTDASGCSIAYILAQKDDKNREVAIAYGGRALRSSERNWSISELEMLAVIEGIKQYHVYLFDKPFRILTDHSALQYIQNSKLTTGRLSRWSLFLQQYRYQIEYRKGKLNANADALSRREYSPTVSPPSTWVSTVAANDRQLPEIVASLVTTSDDTQDLADRYVELNALRHVCAVTDTDPIDVKQQQLDDCKLSPIIKYLKQDKLPSDLSEDKEHKFIAESHEYVVDPDDGLLYHMYYPRSRGPRVDRLVKQLCVPNTLKPDIMLAYHDGLMSGHQGFDRTFHLIRLKYYWRNMYAEIKQYVASCKDCQLNKRDAHKHKVPLKPIPCEGIFRRLHIDLFGPLKKVNGYKYVLLVVCGFSKWPEAFPIKTLTGEEIARVLYSEVICRWGTPYSLLSDRGTNFLSTIVTELCKLFQIKKYKTSSWNPACNGIAERRMAVLAQTLRAYVDKNQENWPDILPSVMAAMRATPSVTSTLFSPYKILLGEEMRLPLDTELIPSPTLQQSVYDRLQDITEQFKITREVAKQNIEQAQQRSKRYHDRKAVEPTFDIGDQVVMNNVRKQKGLNPKLQPKKLGPFYIVDADKEYHTYLLRDCATHKQVRSRIHAKRLTKFVDVDIRNIQPPLEDAQGNLTIDDNHSQNNNDDHSQNDNDNRSQNDNNQNDNLSQNDNTQDNDPDDDLDSNLGEIDNDLNGNHNTQNQNNPSTSQQSQTKKVSKIIKCRSYKGTKWYFVRWEGQKKSEWVMENSLPKADVQNFHITKTQKGRAKKKVQRSRTS